MADPKPAKVILPVPNRRRSGEVSPFRNLVFWLGGITLVILVAWGLGFRFGAEQQSAPLDPATPEPAPALAENPPPAEGPSYSPAPGSSEAPAPSATGGISLSAEPEQAHFELRQRHTSFRTMADGPVALTGLPAGEYDLHTSHPGYQPAAASLTVVAGELREFPRVQLIPTSGVNETPPETMLAETAEGSAELTSDPAGAEVWLRIAEEPGLRRLGVTPLTLPLPSGSHEFEFRLPNSPTRLVTAVVEAAKTASAKASWKTLPIQVTTTPPGATLQADGEDPLTTGPAVTPVTLNLREGRHEITASYPGLESVHVPVFIGETSPEPLQVSFRYASLKLTSEPEGAGIFSQGKQIGQTPMGLPALAPGTHQFVLRREGHARTALNLTLRNGDQREIHTNLAVNPQPEPGFPFTNGQGLRMVWVPRLNGWAQATEMTQAAYQAIMNLNPSEFKDPSRPVENLTWTDAFRFCEKLTTAEQSRGYLPPGSQYTLPTDDQWSLLAEGSSLDQGVHSLAVLRESTAPAGSLPPSPLGVQDAIGNVWEWCLDWYSPAVLDRALREGSPREQDKVGATHKVLRGGSWNRSVANQLQISIRRAALPTQHKDYETGFRVVLLPRFE